MIVCPNCNHQNPEGATQCEACYTPLPTTMSCPNCGAPVQTDASFCGQCGFSLDQEAASSSPVPATVVSQPDTSEVTSAGMPDPPTMTPPDPDLMETNAPAIESEPPSTRPPPPPAQQSSSTTQLQIQTAKLLHVQTDTVIEFPQNLFVIHIGKPNDQIPPDIDVSGFPNSEIVSRIHADIRVEGDTYFVEDVGSSNGTYINHTPLPAGNRHRLRPGDRISLGKGDKMTFIFQQS